MMIVEKAALSNGAHRNQTSTGTVPDGWIALEARYEPLLPFVTITDNGDGAYTVTDNPVAREAQAALDAAQEELVQPPTTEELAEQLAQADAVAIELYEAQAEQEEINAQQDASLIEIFELMEV